MQLLPFAAVQVIVAFCATVNAPPLGETVVTGGVLMTVCIELLVVAEAVSPELPFPQLTKTLVMEISKAWLNLVVFMGPLVGK